MLRWVTDLFLGAATSYLLNQKKSSNQSVMLKLGFMLLRRAIFIALSGIVAVSLMLGAIFISIIDLGNYINAFGVLGFTAVGQLGILLLALSGIGLFFIKKSSLELRPEELQAMQLAEQNSVGEVLLTSIADLLRGRQQQSQNSGPVEKVKPGVGAAARESSAYEPYIN